jgi:DNA-binding GntR family transcriptional regulator
MMECFSIDLLKAMGIRNLPEVESTLDKTSNLSMPANSDTYDKFNYLKAIANFHIKLVQAAGNSELIYFYHSIFSILARYQSMYTYISGLMDESQQEHEEFLKSIKDADYEQAKEILKNHINKFVILVEDKLGNMDKTHQTRATNQSGNHRLMN